MADYRAIFWPPCNNGGYWPIRATPWVKAQCQAVQARVASGELVPCGSRARILREFDLVELVPVLGNTGRRAFARCYAHPTVVRIANLDCPPEWRRRLLDLWVRAGLARGMIDSLSTEELLSVAYPEVTQ